MVNDLSDDDFGDDAEYELAEIDELIRLNHPSLQEVLAEMVYHPQRALRIEAALRLAELFQDVRAVPVLAEALDDPDRHVRKSAGDALWEIGDADTRSLIALLYHSHGQLRDVVADALSRIGWQADLINDEVAYRIAVQDWRGCALLGREAVPALIPSLKDPDGAVRRAMAWVLGQIRDSRAVSGLIELLPDTGDGMFRMGVRVCDIAAEALERIGTPEALEAVSQWRAAQSADEGWETPKQPETQ